MKHRSAVISDIGLTRRENEDRFLCDGPLGLFGVADGIGGLPGGAEAADLTVREITSGVRDGGLRPDLVAITQIANERVRQLGQAIEPHNGIGSTLTFGVFRHGRLQLAHVGDSRVYVLRKGDFACLTEDHTVGNEARILRARGIKAEHSLHQRNALTRCIGMSGRPEVDYQEIAVHTGDRYLFCTDGIFRMISEPELADIVSGPESPKEMLHLVLTLALKRGGHDNLTAVLVFIDEA